MIWNTIYIGDFMIISVNNEKTTLLDENYQITDEDIREAMEGYDPCDGCEPALDKNGQVLCSQCEYLKK